MKREIYTTPTLTVIEFRPEMFIATSVTEEQLQDMNNYTVYDPEF